MKGLLALNKCPDCKNGNPPDLDLPIGEQAFVPKPELSPEEKAKLPSLLISCGGGSFSLAHPTNTANITSPNYPSYYDNLDNCNWTISNPLNSAGFTIQMHMNYFSTESHYDYLRVASGGRVLRSFSGYYSHQSYVFDTASLNVTFCSDHSITRRGFSITFSLVGETRLDDCNLSGNFSCVCDPGYTGPNCSQTIDWCAAPALGSGGETVGEVCGRHGTCTSSPSAGASCVCSYGFQGSLCQSPIPGVIAESERCALFNNSVVAHETVVFHCPPGQRCIPDDINCPFERPDDCPNPIGWCVQKGSGEAFIAAAKAKVAQHANTHDQFFRDASVCSGHGSGQCACEQGFAGPYCENEINYCVQQASGLVSPPSVGSLCGPHGNCSSSNSGASCVCAPGWSGAFCDAPIPNVVTISNRCLLYASGSDTSVPVGCGVGSGLRCLSDNIDCAFQHCANPIGWCLPAAPVAAMIAEVAEKINIPPIV